MTGSARMKAKISAMPIVVGERLADPERHRLVSFGRARQAARSPCPAAGSRPPATRGSPPKRRCRAARARRPHLQLGRDHARALLHGVGRAERAVARPHLLLGLVRERLVDDAEQRVVLPHAEAERDRERRQAR